MNKGMLLIGILIVHGSTTGLALKCHVCTNLKVAECLEISEPDDDRFLIECPTNTTMCVTEIKAGDVDKVYRQCASTKWSCKNACATCETDGCNHNNDVDEDTSFPTLAVSPIEIVMANIYGIGAIALVTILIVVWCIVRCCTRDKGDDDDEEDIDEEDIDKEADYEEEEEEYVSDDSIEREYEEYDQKAAEAYNKRKQHKEESV